MRISGIISLRVLLVALILMLLGHVSAVYGQQQPAMKQVIQPAQPLQPVQPAQPTQPAQPIQPPAQNIQQPVRMPQYPHIREFTLTPNVWLVGEHGDITFRWNVEPGPSGSPIRSVAISRTSGYGPEISYSSLGGIGEYSHGISYYFSEGRTVYTLTAADLNGATSTRTVELEARSIVSVRRDISFVSLSAEPEEITEGTPFTFIVQLENRSGMSVAGVNFPIYGKNISLMEASMPLGSEPPPPNQGELRDQVINPGTNTYRIRCTPGLPSGLGDVYLFEIKPARESVVFLYIWSRLEFSRTASGVNYYRLRAGSRTFGE